MAGSAPFLTRGFLRGNRCMALTNVRRINDGICTTTVPVKLDRCNYVRGGRSNDCG